ncbi:MAG TPA: glucoamylase family protein [Thermoanaerobaculia bacterium]|nr:glucoamylase family protein [Thermoanaerobaculia bacterium]
MPFIALLFLITACATQTTPPPATPLPPPVRFDEPALLDDLQHRTFLWFWETANPKNGLVPDRWPAKSPSSIAAVGFGLTAYPVGVERRWITREQARERVLATLEFFANAPQGPDAKGVTGFKGFFYHFLDMETGERHQTNELSTIDSTLLFAGMLFCQSYFDQEHPDELRIRNLAEQLYTAADWRYFLVNAPLLQMSWRPERGYGAGIWRGLNEGAILYILALASPSHPVGKESWDAWVSTYRWLPFYGQEHINFAPLFGHQYSHVWIDFRGIHDDYLREKGIDLFENSRRATISQRAYAMDNPNLWRDYGENVWGLTASDGPGRGKLSIDGTERQFHGYMARGAAATEIRDDGTIAPTAAIGSIPFAPEVVVPLIAELKERYGDALYQRYGFLDAFNPTLQEPPPFLRKGTVRPGLGWFNDDYLGIDQGPILLMIENYRTGFIWEVMRKNPHIIRGLERAGFRGGWLEGAP